MSPIAENLKDFFYDIYNGGANVLYITDSRGSLLVTDRFPRGLKNSWKPKQWGQIFGQPVNGSSDINVVVNQNGGSYTNNTRTPLSCGAGTPPAAPTALPVYNDGTSGITPIYGWDSVFTGELAGEQPLIINQFDTSTWGSQPNWSDNLAFNAKYIYKNNASGPLCEIKGFRPAGTNIATTNVDMNVGTAIASATVSCGSGVGVIRCNPYTRNAQVELGKIMIGLGVVFIPTVTSGTGLTVLGNAGWNAYDWYITGANARFDDVSGKNFVDAIGNHTHLIVDLSQNQNNDEAADPAVLAAHILNVVNRFKSFQASITKVLIIPRYSTITYTDAATQAVVDAMYAMAHANNFAWFNQFNRCPSIAELVALGYVSNIDQVHPTGPGSDYFMGNIWQAGMAALNVGNAYNRLKLVTGGSLNGL